MAHGLVQPRVVDGGSRGHPGCVFDADSPEDHLGAPEGSEENAESWWTPKRVELLGWLEESAPALAPLYRGALVLAMRDRFPGRAHFIAHAIREIRNRLPGALGPTVKRRDAGYMDLTAKVHRRWVAEGLPEDGRLASREESVPSASGPARRDVSFEFPASVGSLIERHIAAQANRADRLSDLRHNPTPTGPRSSPSSPASECPGHQPNPSTRRLSSMAASRRTASVCCWRHFAVRRAILSAKGSPSSGVGSAPT